MSRMSGTIALLAAVMLAAAALDGARSEPLKVAVFDLELVNTSTPHVPPTGAEQARLAMLSERLRAALEAGATIEVVDIGAVREAAAHSNLQACAACDRRFAEAVGADVSATGVIYKMSELILSLSVFMRDVPSGKIIGAFTADFRGNTDESWTRALDWLLKHRILPEEAPT
jgi:hypothetical protein